MATLATMATEDENESKPQPMDVSSNNNDPLSQNRDSAATTGGEATTVVTKSSVSETTTDSASKSAMVPLKPDQIDLCYNASMEHFEKVMRTVKTRDLSRELQDGFDALRERGRGAEAQEYHQDGVHLTT
jgi:hypothetical protein